METAIVICITIVICVFLVGFYINKYLAKVIDNDNTTNSMFDDIDTIKEIVDRCEQIETYSEAMKHNIKTLKHIISKYIEENEDVDTSTKES